MTVVKYKNPNVQIKNVPTKIKKTNKQNDNLVINEVEDKNGLVTTTE